MVSRFLEVSERIMHAAGGPYATHSIPDIYVDRRVMVV
jgi:hypothetical protein